jgi:2-polyprenyl-3-methyl-5-hydroxy-6-metoxy-1,4-benzoquinol methylase
LSSSFSSHIPLFLKQLNEVDVDVISKDVYVKKYLQHLIDHGHYFVTIYSKVLEKGVANAPKKVVDIQLLDYGAGVGLLGIFASYCGVKKVSINEMDPVFLAAAAKLSDHFNRKEIVFIPGSLASDFDSALWGKPDVLVATDVIEHLYDLDDFVSCCVSINREMSMVFTTGSNPANFWKVSRLQKLQWRDEWQGNAEENDDVLAGYGHEAYRSMRKKIIQSFDPSLTLNEVENLVDNTRGLIKKDIHEAVSHYVKYGHLQKTTDDSYNTCNPETGSWTERILPFEAYDLIFNKHHLSVRYESGFYNTDKKGLKKAIALFANLLLPIFGKRIAPFIFIETKNIHK